MKELWVCNRFNSLVEHVFTSPPNQLPVLVFMPLSLLENKNCRYIYASLFLIFITLVHAGDLTCLWWGLVFTPAAAVAVSPTIPTRKLKTRL